MKAAPRTAWQRTRRLSFLTAVVVWLLAVLLPLAAPMLEAVAVLGMPLSYYVGSQGIPIALVIAFLVHLIAQRRIDRMPTPIGRRLEAWHRLRALKLGTAC